MTSARFASLLLQFKRADVAPRSAWPRLSALVCRQRLPVRVNAVGLRNLVDRDAALTKSLRRCRASVVGERPKAESLGRDVHLIGRLVEAAGVARRQNSALSLSRWARSVIR